MNKAELIHAVAEATKLSQADADRAVAAVLGGITGALVKGEQVVLVGFGTFTVNDLLRVPAKARARLQNPISAQHLEVNARMRSELPRDIFVDVSQLLCGNGTTCPLFTDDGKLITYDGGHLTREGARYYGQRLAQSAQIRRLLGMP